MYKVGPSVGGDAIKLRPLDLRRRSTDGGDQMMNYLERSDGRNMEGWAMQYEPSILGERTVVIKSEDRNRGEHG